MSKHPAIFLLIFAQVSRAEVYAFIGSPVLAEKTGESCMKYMKEPDAICMDMAFRLVYKIEKQLKGSIQEPTIEMVGFYHYRGLPAYTDYDPALLFVSGSPQNGFILKSIEPVLGGDEEDAYICKQRSTSDEEECPEKEDIENHVAQLSTKF